MHFSVAAVMLRLKHPKLFNQSTCRCLWEHQAPCMACMDHPHHSRVLAGVGVVLALLGVWRFEWYSSLVLTVGSMLRKRMRGTTDSSLDSMDKSQESKDDEERMGPFWHYTNEEGADGINESGTLVPSKRVDLIDAVAGEGIYVTDSDPIQNSKTDILESWQRNPRQRRQGRLLCRVHGQHKALGCQGGPGACVRHHGQRWQWCGDEIDRFRHTGPPQT